MRLTDAWFQLRPHAEQSRAWRDQHRFVALACGRGSGKTELARRRIVRHLAYKKPWPDPMYFYALPTYAQARRVAWKKIRRLIPDSWVAKSSDTGMMVETVFGSTLYVVGMDKPQRIEGDQWDGGVIDESSDQKPGVFDLNVRPALSHRNAWCWRIGVPKRTGCGALEFKEFFELGLSGEDPDVSAYSWSSRGVLTESEILSAARQLDARDFAEQYDASWQSVGGLVFWAFDDVLNVSNQMCCYEPSKRIAVGSDFNVNPMCWVIGHREKNELRIFDEIIIRDTNTRKTLDELFKRYGQHASGWDFFGDATGAARRTSASESDYIQIRNDKRFAGARVWYPRANPRLADRFAACNALFCNALHERHLFVNPRCKMLIKDLGSRAYKKGTSEPDDYGDVGHVTDALGYIVHRCWPIALDGDDSMPGVAAG
jgi:hypothetical protein